MQMSICRFHDLLNVVLENNETAEKSTVKILGRFFSISAKTKLSCLFSSICP